MMYNKKFVLVSFKISLSLFFIIYILSKINLKDTILTFQTLNIYFFFVAFFIQIINIPIRSYNWKQLLSVQGIHIPSKTLIKITLIATFLNNFLPTMGGDVVRAHEVSRYSTQLIKSASTIAFQRLAGLIAIIIYSVIGVIIGFKIAEIRNVAILVGILALVLLFFLIIIYNIKKFKRFKIIKIILQYDVKNIIKKLYNSINIYREHRKECINILIVSLISELIIIIYFYFISLSLHQDINLLYFFIFIPIITIIEMLPISINGIGVREGAFLYFFTKIGVPGYIAISMSLLYYLNKVGISLIGGVIYALRRN